IYQTIKKMLIFEWRSQEKDIITKKSIFMATKTVVAEMKIDFPYNNDRLRADEVNLRGNEDGRVFLIRIFT
ncbi:hypothetical protein, partial [Parabacteroides johnsonii]